MPETRYYSGRTIPRRVYWLREVFKDEVYYKIGLSKNPERRAKVLKGELVYSEPGTWHDEHFYHRWFAHLQVKGQLNIYGYELPLRRGIMQGDEWFHDRNGEISEMLIEKRKETP